MRKRPALQTAAFKKEGEIKVYFTQRNKAAKISLTFSTVVNFDAPDAIEDAWLLRNPSITITPSKMYIMTMLGYIRKMVSNIFKIQLYSFRVDSVCDVQTPHPGILSILNRENGAGGPICCCCWSVKGEPALDKNREVPRAFVWTVNLHAHVLQLY